MSTKLTLTIDKSVIVKAKKHAADSGTSLSKMVENYLKAILQQETKKDTEISPIIMSLKGRLKPTDTDNYKEELSQTLSEKYL